MKAFYKDVEIKAYNWYLQKRVVDLEFHTKEEFIKAIELGTGTFKNQPFYIRCSFKSYTKPYNNNKTGGSGGGNTTGRYNNNSSSNNNPRNNDRPYA